MVMTKTQWIELKRTMRTNAVYFLCISLISALGFIGCLGVYFTGIAVRNMGNDFYDTCHFSDYMLRISDSAGSAGFTAEDIDSVRKLEGVSASEGVFSVQAAISSSNSSAIAEFTVLPDNVNLPSLVQGRLPETSDECVLESEFADINNLSPGDTITVTSLSSALMHNNLIVVGIVNDPRAILLNEENVRGSSALGDGSVDTLIHLTRDAVAMPSCNAIAVTFDKPENCDRFSAEYSRLSKAFRETLEDWASANNHPGIMIMPAETNPSFFIFSGDVKTIRTVAIACGSLFLILAFLTSYTFIDCLVNEESHQCGMLLAQGMRAWEVFRKYHIFCFASVILGCASGAITVRYWIQGFIYNTAYGYAYVFNNFSPDFNWKLAILAFIVESVCVTGASFISCATIAKRKLTDLLSGSHMGRGGNPAKEYLPRSKFLFHFRITLRAVTHNYKLLLATVTATAGCTVLLGCMLTIWASLNQIGDKQYSDILKANLTATLSINMSGEDRASFEDALNGIMFERGRSAALLALTPSGDWASVSLCCTENDFPDALFSLTDIETGGTPDFTNGFWITRKMQEVFDLKKGDLLNLYLPDGTAIEIEIAGALEYYVGFPIFCSSAQYRENFGNLQNLNRYYIQTDSPDDTALHLSASSGMIEIESASSLSASLASKIKAVSTVLIVVLVLSLILSAIILLTQSILSLKDKKRELVTMRILGFSRSEVHRVLLSENIMMLVVGLLIGIPPAYLLGGILVKGIEFNTLQNVRGCNLTMTLIGAGIAALFTAVMQLVALIRTGRFGLTDISDD